jgi:hypothetical protein
MLREAIEVVREIVCWTLVTASCVTIAATCAVVFAP